MSFEKLGLSDPLVKAVVEKGYSSPSPIQSKSIPTVLQGADLLACAQTGTGKTAGFVLPLLEILNSNHTGKTIHPRALIIAPTRELAAQIHESILAYGKHLTLRSTIVYGGVKMNRQIMRLRKGIDILVATPGRLLDLTQQGAVKLSAVEILVLDEADRMLDMGFINDIKKIMGHLPKKRQNLLFSATFCNDIRKFAKGLLSNAVEVNIAPKNLAAKSVEHKIHPVDKVRKSELLSYLIREKNWYQALVFTRTKHGADKLVKRLAKDNIQALAIHGNKSQNRRTSTLSSFKQGKLQILVATDVASRGLDIEQLPQVVNFDLPSVPEDYVHRIGRTGRAGTKGQAISLVSADEIKQLKDIERLLKQSIKREFIADYEPKHDLPAAAPAKTSKTTNKSKRSSSRNSTKMPDSKSRKRRTRDSSSKNPTHKRGRPGRNSRRNSQGDPKRG